MIRSTETSFFEEGDETRLCRRCLFLIYEERTVLVLARKLVVKFLSAHIVDVTPGAGDVDTTCAHRTIA